MKVEGSYFIDINSILPAPALDEFYVGVDDKKRPAYTIKKDIPITRNTLPVIGKLFEWRIIKAGDVVAIKNIDNSRSTVTDFKYVDFNGKKLIFNK